MESYAIVDLQFGSTGKGLLAAKLAYDRQPDAIVTAWGPNAGHTAYDLEGNQYIHTMLANGIVSPSVKSVFIGAGSVINMDSLVDEIQSAATKLSHPMPKIYIHPHAAIVTADHRNAESASMVGIGSTMKGTGAAVCHKIGRNVDPSKQNTAIERVQFHKLQNYVTVLRSHRAWLAQLGEVELLQIEGAQGYSLGINSGFYPYTTYRECTVQQLLVDCSLPFHTPYVYGSCRTYPIRVANRFNADGEMVGWSGPFYGESEEISFADIGVEPELTTVTKLPRRIGTWSREQVVEACVMNGVNEVFLNFANYVDDIDVLSNMVLDLNDELLEEGLDCWVTMLGHGPRVADIQEVKYKTTASVDKEQ